MLSCKSKPAEMETTTPTDDKSSLAANTTEPLNPSKADITEQPKDSRPSTTEVSPDDNLPRILWGVLPFPWLTDETLDDINHLLKEKGIQCRVEVIRTSASGLEYEKWLEELKAKGEAPDIMLSGYWENGTLDLIAFAKNEFLPLNDFLKTEEGKALWNSYSELEWERVTVDGNIYTLPGRSDTLKNQGEVYLWIKDSYREEFENHFDGSYESLHKMCGMNSEGEQIIVAENLSENIILAFLDAKEMFFASYDPKAEQVIDLLKLSKTKDFIRMLYEDCRDGKWVNEADTNNIPSNAMVYICTDRINPPKGYTETILSSAHFRSFMSSSYGVVASSPNKELAQKVLSVCFSDPGMASRLSWFSEDAEKWRMQTEYLKTREPSPITGFIPTLTTKQKDELSVYRNDLFGLVSSIYIMQNGKTSINPDYLQLLEDSFANPKDYGDVFDVINEQLKRWFEQKDE